MKWFHEHFASDCIGCDAAFRQEVERLSTTGLQVMGGIAAAVPVFMVGALLVFGQPLPLHGELFAGMVVLLGLGVLVGARRGWFGRHAREVGLGTALLVFALLMCVSLGKASVSPGSEKYVVGQAALILLNALLTLPVHPWQALGLGLGMTSLYALGSQAALHMGVLPDLSSGPMNTVFLLLTTVLGTGLSAVNYRRLYQSFGTHQRELQASENLRRAQSRALVTENAATMGRLAAALSHELNSPVGVLKSAVDTLGVLAARRASVPEEQKPRLEVIESQLRHAARESATRLQELVSRLQRFTNLDRAEVQPVDLNALLKDVLYLLESDRPFQTAIELQFQTLPLVLCRPQQLSAVFSHLLHTAMEHANGAGPVKLTTLHPDGHVVVEIGHRGKTLSAEQLSGIFEPGFVVRENRVASGNWNFFGSRQIVREHGGDIQIESAENRGTTVRVTLPATGEETSVNPAAASAASGGAGLRSL